MKTTLLTKIVCTALIKWNYEKDIETNFCLTPLDSYKIAVQQFFAQRIPVITILWHRTVAHSWLILHHKLCYAEIVFDLPSWNSVGTIIRVLDFCSLCCRLKECSEKCKFQKLLSTYLINKVGFNFMIGKDVMLLTHNTVTHFQCSINHCYKNGYSPDGFCPWWWFGTYQITKSMNTCSTSKVLQYF